VITADRSGSIGGGRRSPSHPTVQEYIDLYGVSAGAAVDGRAHPPMIADVHDLRHAISQYEPDDKYKSPSLDARKENPPPR